MGDEAVHIAFGDEGHGDYLFCSLSMLIYRLGDPVAFHDPPTMAGERVAGVAIPKGLCHILAAEQHLAVLLKGTDFSKLGVFKNLQVVHVTLPFSCLPFSPMVKLKRKGGEPHERAGVIGLYRPSFG